MIYLAHVKLKKGVFTHICDETCGCEQSASMRMTSDIIHAVLANWKKRFSSTEKD
jgi:hypothetical protein